MQPVVDEHDPASETALGAVHVAALGLDVVRSNLRLKVPAG